MIYSRTLCRRSQILASALRPPARKDHGDLSPSRSGTTRTATGTKGKGPPHSGLRASSGGAGGEAEATCPQVCGVSAPRRGGLWPGLRLCCVACGPNALVPRIGLVDGAATYLRHAAAYERLANVTHSGQRGCVYSRGGSGLPGGRPGPGPEGGRALSWGSLPLLYTRDLAGDSVTWSLLPFLQCEDKVPNSLGDQEPA